MGVRISDKEVAALIQCANMGLTQGQAAEQTLLSPTTVTRAATQYGIRFHTYRENEDGRNARSAGRNRATKAASEIDDRRQQEEKQAQPKNAIRRNPSSSFNDRKKARRERAIERIDCAKTPAEKKEIAYAWNVMEFEIEMAMLKKRPPLPVPERKKESAAAAMTMAKIEKINAADIVREMIINCFSPGEDLTAREISQKLMEQDVEMTAQTVNGFVNGMAQAGKLSRYKGPSDRYDRTYWRYYLPQEAGNE
jgi:hypothetical protein